MRSVSSAYLSALTNARENGLIVRKMAYFTAKDRGTGDPAYYGFWTGDEPITTNVVSTTTGSAVERTYVGSVGLEVGQIARVSNMTIQNVAITLSQIEATALALVREDDPRLATVEIHDCLLGTDGLPVANPEPVFYGEIDQASIKTPSAGSVGGIEMMAVSSAIVLLSLTNPRKRSYAGQAQRTADQFGRYSNATAYSKIYWGENAP